MTAAQVLRIAVGEGDHSVQVSCGDHRRDYPLRVIQAAQPAAPAVRVTLSAEERSLQALLAGRLCVVVDSCAPVCGLHLTVDLEAAGARFSVSGPLGPLPQTISGDHPILRQLLDEDVRYHLSCVGAATIRAQVGHLATTSWQLERTLQPCWWNLGPEVQLLSEGGPLPFGMVRVDDPIAGPTDGPSGEDAYLLAPRGLDVGEYGAASPFATLCIAPARVQLALPSIRKPHLVRRRRGTSPSVGFEDLMEAYLRWSLAETRSAIGDLRRGQVSALLEAWVAEVCCGSAWAEAEAALPREGPWVLFEQACRDLQLGGDDYVELTAAQAAEVRRLAVAEVRRSMPGLWARLGPPSDLGDEDYAALDRAFAAAYGLLATRCRARGEEDLADELDNADPGDDPALWDQALGQAFHAIKMPGLTAMLLPSGPASRRLVGLDCGGLSLDEIADELHEWSRECSPRAFAGQPPTRETLRVIYALWAAPGVALAADWRGALDTMLAERSIARATRFLALKVRRARRGDV